MTRDSFIKYAIGIPAKNEALQIQRCLSAIDLQSPALLKNLIVVLLVNNSTDGTAAIGKKLANRLQFRLDIREVDLPHEERYAGMARKRAMDAAYLSLANKTEGIVLTTDADSAVAPDWLEKNLAALNQADAVAGDVDYVLDAGMSGDPVCAAKHLEAQYEAVLAEIDALLDPIPHNPWPRHRMESGASLALQGLSYLRIGGLPALAVGEDRGLCECIEVHGLRLRHDPNVRVSTSVRLYGRARGGAADFLRRRHGVGDDRCGADLVPVDQAAFIAQLRRWTRVAFSRRNVSPRCLEHQLALPTGTGEQIFSVATFGAAWQLIRQSSLRLVAQPLALGELSSQLHRGQRLIRHLRQQEVFILQPGEDRADTRWSSPAHALARHLQAAV